MDKNPLAGISIPSIEQIVDEAMRCVPRSHIDLGNPIMRERLRQALMTGLKFVADFEL
jgi:hypothetical protein